MSGGDGDRTFRIVGERPIWSGRIVLAIADVEGPDGSRHDREVVHHPGAVGVVPVHEDGSVTLLRQYRAPLDADLWEVPAGLRDVDGEPTATTAERELAEEAGLRADRFDHLMTFHNSPGFSDEAVVVYEATGLTAVPDDRQGIEEQHMLVARVPLSEALSMIDDGRITDAKTVIALLAVARRRMSRG